MPTTYKPKFHHDEMRSGVRVGFTRTNEHRRCTIFSPQQAAWLAREAERRNTTIPVIIRSLVKAAMIESVS